MDSRLFPAIIGIGFLILCGIAYMFDSTEGAIIFAILGGLFLGGAIFGDTVRTHNIAYGQKEDSETSVGSRSITDIK